MNDGFDRDDKPVSEKSSGGCWKWVLIFGGIGAVCLLICCGVGGYLAMQMKPTMVQTPAEVDALAQEIADIDVPESLTGKVGMTMNLGFMSMKMCMFEHSEGRGMMQLMEMQINVGDPQEAEAQLKQQMRSQGAAEMKQINVDSSETRELVIGGEPATFTFIKGKDVATSTEYRELKGQFKGKSGIAILQLQLEAEAWSDEEIDAMLESMQ